MHISAGNFLQQTATKGKPQPCLLCIFSCQATSRPASLDMRDSHLQDYESSITAAIRLLHSAYSWCRLQGLATAGAQQSPTEFMYRKEWQVAASSPQHSGAGSFRLHVGAPKLTTLTLSGEHCWSRVTGIEAPSALRGLEALQRATTDKGIARVCPDLNGSAACIRVF